MDHNQIIEQEKAAREAQGRNVEAGPSKTKPLGLQSKTKPNSPSPPRHVETEAVATPSGKPIGSSKAVEEPTGNDDARSVLSGHSDVSLDPMGVIDRLTEEAEAVEEQHQVVLEEVIEVAEDVDAPPGFSTVIVAKSRVGAKVKPPPAASSFPKGTVRAPTEDKDKPPPAASSFPKGTVRAPTEDKDKPTAKLKTIAKPSPKPKPNQSEEDIPMTTTNQSRIDMTTPTQVNESPEQMP
ncbi:unnamed protein product [Calypogeia fissa]